MHNKIAPAVERAKRNKGIEIQFNCCNLDEQAMYRMVSAVEKSTCIGKIYCDWNPGNNAYTKEAMKRAIIATKSPITRWNGEELPEDIKQARREHEAKEAKEKGKEEEERSAFLASLNTRVPTRDELNLAQRESQSITPQITSKKEELKLAAEQVAQEEAKEKALNEEMAQLQTAHQEKMAQLQAAHEEQMGKLQQDLTNAKTSLTNLHSESVQLQAQVDELAKKLFPHDAVIKRVQELKGMFAQVDLPPSAAAPLQPPPPQAQDASICSICLDNAINASFLCGHRFCKTCANAMFESAKKECPNCRDPIKGIIPSY